MLEDQTVPATPRPWHEDGLHVAHLVTVPESAYLLLGVELDHLVNRGHRVTVITGPGKPLEQLRKRHPDVEIELLGSLTRRMDPRSDVVAAAQLFRVLRRLRPDVLHTHMPKTGWVGRVVGRLARVPLVINTCHGLYARQARSRLGWTGGLAMEWFSEAFGHKNLFQNRDDMAQMHRLAPWRKHEYIGNGTDPDYYCVTEQDRVAARAHFGFEQDELVVGGVGRLIAHKGIAEYQATAEWLRGRARFVWVGPQEPDKATAVGFSSDAVEYLGAQEDMRRVYAALDLFVLPSYMEGVPRSAMEAAAAGVPVVLTDIPGSRDLARAGSAALVPPRDASALTERVAMLLNEPKAREELASRGASRIRTHHDQRDLASVLERRYVEAFRATPSTFFRRGPS